MGNQYHDAKGRFTNRNGQLKNVAAAIESGNWEAFVAEKKALDEIDTARGYVPEVLARNGITEASTYKDDELIERDRLIKEGSRQEIEAFLEERVNRPEFIKLLNERDSARQLAKDLKAEYDFMAANAEEHPELDYEEVRLKGMHLLDTFETLQILKQQTEDYKDITAPAVSRLSELVQAEQEANGTYRVYEDDTLNKLERVGDFESGSREWLEARQDGVGGSDVGKIIGAYKQYAQRDYEEVLASKINPITDEEVEAQAAGHAEFEGAAGRGNAWEEAIAQRFAENNPDANITHCKGSWRNTDHPNQKVNFDGLMADKDGNIDGVLEIKTASDASKWGDVETGLDGVPSGYRAQVLHYAKNGGFKRGAVAVIIDDREYREYHFKMTPELEAEAQANFDKTQKFWEEVEARKAGTFVEKVTARNRKGFSMNALNSGTAGAKTAIFQEAAIYREQDVEAVRARYEELLSKEDRKDPEKVRAALTKLYTEHDPATNKNKIIALDLETSSGQPTKGRIIEVGISVRSPQGGEEKKFSKLYGLSKKSLAATGTGPVEVHQITEGMIAKKRQFNHPEEEKALLSVLQEGTLMAHNAPFEVRWLKLHLPGFEKAYRAGKIKVLDTRNLSQKFVHDTKDNTLKTFVEKYEDEYKDAHRAYNDARMMGEAFEKFAQDLHSRDN